MTREEAKEILTHNWTRVDNPNYSESELDEAIFMAIEALSADTVSREHHDMEVKELKHQIKDQADMVSVVRCKDCKYQNECEEMVLFDINDDEVIGHRVHWCSYGRRE